MVGKITMQLGKGYHAAMPTKYIQKISMPIDSNQKGGMRLR